MIEPANEEAHMHASLKRHDFMGLVNLYNYKRIRIIGAYYRGLFFPLYALINQIIRYTYRTTFLV